MQHPNLWDKLALHIYPRYLYPGQPANTVAKTNVNVVHKLPAATPVWRTTNSVNLPSGSILKFLGLAKNHKFLIDVEPMYSLFEIIHTANSPDSSLEHQVSIGDFVCVSPLERKFIYPSA